MIKFKNVNRILLIKLRGIGDVVLSTVIFDSIVNYFPNAVIDFLTEKPGSAALKNIPAINHILIYYRNSTWERLKLFPFIRSKKYDLVIDLFSNPASAQITFLSGAKYRMGFPYKGRKYAYNIYGPVERAKFQAAQLHLELLKNAGIPIVNKNLHFIVDSNSKIFAAKWFGELENRFNVGIIPGGGWASKRCDPVKFAEIADAVYIKYNANIILICGPGDKHDAEQIRTMMKNNSHLIQLASIQNMAAIINKCDVVIANDCGPMHISSAVGTPNLSLHGPTNPRLQDSFGTIHHFVINDKLDCIVCNLLECPRNHECFLELPVEWVLQEFEVLLRNNNLYYKI